MFPRFIAGVNWFISENFGRKPWSLPSLPLNVKGWVLRSCICFPFNHLSLVDLVGVTHCNSLQLPDAAGIVPAFSSHDLFQDVGCGAHVLAQWGWYLRGHSTDLNGFVLEVCRCQIPYKWSLKLREIGHINNMIFGFNLILILYYNIIYIYIYIYCMCVWESGLYRVYQNMVDVPPIHGNYHDEN